MDKNLSLQSDPIFALATPPGRSAIAGLRLSGENLLTFVIPLLRTLKGTPLAAQLFYDTPRKTHLLTINNRNNSYSIDQVLVTFFPKPHSFTGEDQMEIFPHGSPALLEKIFQELILCGLRQAEPGEFSRRAFIHGKMDLIQAESLMSLIEAKTFRAAQVASRNLSGGLSERIEKIKHNILDVLAHLEAALDFSDEEISPDEHNILLDKIVLSIGSINNILLNFSTNRALFKGVEIVLAGRPNVGKSSLFNAFLGQKKAIVTEVPGTTRDFKENEWELEGFPITLVDTAGLRETDETVEKEGILWAEEKIATADITLFVAESHIGLLEEDRAIIDKISNKPYFLVWNKSDIPSISSSILHTPTPHPEQTVFISCKKEKGIKELKNKLSDYLGNHFDSSDDNLIVSQRQQQELKSAVQNLEEGVSLIQSDRPGEIIAITLRSALTSLGRLTGEVDQEDLLGEIFSTFCIGK
ncbi:tRNA uridine-5-carboxymethylaminomethyl(34) synthesis GTPase MnmE [Magnetococcales bacterium HHB-1]